MTGPDPTQRHPLDFTDQVVFLAPLAEGRDRIEVGRFTYYDDPDRAEEFFDKNVLYHFEFSPSRLLIGPFCAFATGTTFIMDGANHAMGGISTFPFDIFSEDWSQGFSSKDVNAEGRGDTVVGADVWIGNGAVIMPGVTIGAGAIIAARSVVSRDVPPFTIVAGNPAREIRRRFSDADTARLLEIAWWDWPVDKITRHITTIRSADIDALEAAT